MFLVEIKKTFGLKSSNTLLKSIIYSPLYIYIYIYIMLKKKGIFSPKKKKGNVYRKSRAASSHCKILQLKIYLAHNISFQQLINHIQIIWSSQVQNLVWHVRTWKQRIKPAALCSFSSPAQMWQNFFKSLLDKQCKAGGKKHSRGLLCMFKILTSYS